MRKDANTAAIAGTAARKASAGFTVFSECAVTVKKLALGIGASHHEAHNAPRRGGNSNARKFGYTGGEASKLKESICGKQRHYYLQPWFWLR